MPRYATRYPDFASMPKMAHHPPRDPGACEVNFSYFCVAIVAIVAKKYSLYLRCILLCWLNMIKPHMYTASCIDCTILYQMIVPNESEWYMRSEDEKLQTCAEYVQQLLSWIPGRRASHASIRSGTPFEPFKVYIYNTFVDWLKI